MKYTPTDLYIIGNWEAEEGEDYVVGNTLIEKYNSRVRHVTESYLSFLEETQTQSVKLELRRVRAEFEYFFETLNGHAFEYEKQIKINKQLKSIACKIDGTLEDDTYIERLESLIRVLGVNDLICNNKIKAIKEYYKKFIRGEIL